jgi:AraC-like DNA-binding protein
MSSSPRPKHDKLVGLLHPIVEPVVRLTRYHPSEDLAPFIEHYWFVRWDLGDGPPRDQDTLPHPCVHLAVEPGGISGVFGVVRGRFRKQIRGRGRVAAIRFRPGGFASFWSRPVRELTGRVLALDAVFGRAGAAYEQAILAAPDDDRELVALAEDFLRSRAPRADEPLALITRVIELVTCDRAIARVADLAHAVGVSVRSLQRLFSDRVGVSPKWVICRARLQDAAARVLAGDDVDWSRLALDLGYFDQAHLIRAYRTIIGVSPTAHVRRVRSTARAR